MNWRAIRGFLKVWFVIWITMRLLSDLSEALWIIGLSLIAGGVVWYITDVHIPKQKERLAQDGRADRQH